MSNQLIKKLNGYQRLNRNRFILLRDLILTQEEFLLCEFYITISDWDKEQKDSYGTFQVTNKDAATLLGWKSDTRVSEYKKKLFKKGFLIKEQDGKIRARDFELWQSSKPFAYAETQTPKMETQSAFTEILSLKTEKNLSYSDDSPLVSYKNSSLSNNNEALSSEALDQIIIDIDNTNKEKNNKTLVQISVGQLSNTELLEYSKSVFGEDVKWEN